MSCCMLESHRSGLASCRDISQERGSLLVSVSCKEFVVLVLCACVLCKIFVWELVLFFCPQRS